MLIAEYLLRNKNLIKEQTSNSSCHYYMVCCAEIIDEINAEKYCDNGYCKSASKAHHGCLLTRNHTKKK